MDEQLQFLESMNTIARLGKEGNGHLTRTQVQEQLGGNELNEAQWEVMGEFLFSRQVLLEGYIPKQEEKKEFDQGVENATKYFQTVTVDDLVALGGVVIE